MTPTLTFLKKLKDAPSKDEVIENIVILFTEYDSEESCLTLIKAFEMLDASDENVIDHNEDSETEELKKDLQMLLLIAKTSKECDQIGRRLIDQAEDLLKSSVTSH